MLSTSYQSWRSRIIPSAIHDSGCWAISVALLEQLRTWELQLLRKGLPSPHQETLKDYLILSAERIDEIRRTNKEPHLMHVLLDKYFRKIYRQYYRSDILEQSPTPKLRNYRDMGWRADIRKEHPNKRQNVGIQQRAPGGTFPEHERFIREILGENWTEIIESSDHKGWLKI